MSPTLDAGDEGCLDDAQAEWGQWSPECSTTNDDLNSPYSAADLTQDAHVYPVVRTQCRFNFGVETEEY